MGEGAEGNRTDAESWEFVPYRRLGPFVFGTAPSATPFVGGFLSSEDMGSNDTAASYEAELDGIELTFWNDRLTGVSCDESLVLAGRQMIGVAFNDLRPLFTGEPVIQNWDPLLVVEYDAYGVVFYLDMEWVVESVYVHTDPDSLDAPRQTLERRPDE